MGVIMKRFIILILLLARCPLFAANPTFQQFNPTYFSTNGNVIAIKSTGISAAGGITNGQSSVTLLGTNLLVKVLSPAGGNNGETDYTTATPNREGQLGLAYYGNKEFFLYGAGSTTVGDWVHGFVFPTGISQVGSSNGMGVAATSSTIWNFCGSAAGRAASGDHVFISRNWSTNRNSSGGGFAIAVMYQGADGNMSTWGELDASWQHVPTNRIASLIPGWVEFPFNTGPNLKGLAVCSPTIGPDSGNYSLGMFDGIREVFAVPFWVAGAYQPGDTGWRDAFTVNPNSGFVSAHTNFGVGSKSFFTNDVRFDTKLISGNGSGVEFHFYGGAGGTFSFGTSAADAVDLGITSGVTLRNVGQKVQWLNSTILTNDANGTLGIYDSSFGAGTVKATPLVPSTSTPPTVTGNEGGLWNSNKLVYWVTATGTNNLVPVTYTGLTNIGSAATSLLISIGRAMPNTNYFPSFSLVGTVSSGVGFNYSDVTTTNFTVNLSGVLGADSNARWLVVHAP